MRRRSILVVDDNVDWSQSLALLLGRYEVRQAASSRQGLRLARRQPFHLYILDQRLPEMTGLELCRCIREFDANTPVMICSANRMGSQMLVNAGATSFFQKADDVGLFIRRVDELVRAQALRNATARDEEETAIREHCAGARKVAAQRDATASAANHAMQEQVAAARQVLENIRAARSRAFQVYVERGGSRAGFVSEWPHLAATLRA
jgi:DNA-binding response OmpR family regulator